jgi:hypothetical protein
MNTHVVAKRFPGPGSQVFTSGDEVDASLWRNTKKLVEQGYLRPLDEQEEPARKRGRPRKEVSDGSTT